MDLDKILMVSSSAADTDAQFAFKLPQAQKDRLITFCQDNHLSAGRVMRELLAQFLDNAGA